MTLSETSESLPAKSAVDAAANIHGQPPITIGVLALQGDVREHLRVLDGLGVRTRSVRRAGELDGLDGIIIPGGESTTMSRLLDVFELRGRLQDRLDAGLPAYGSCAGMIMLANQILDGRADQVPLRAIDITVRRNAFGRQVDSFESEVELVGIDGVIPAVFIRAPWVESVGAGVQVLGTVAGHPVAVRTERVLVTSFHPEITGDTRVHELFVRMVSAAAAGGPTSTSAAAPTAPNAPSIAVEQ